MVFVAKYFEELTPSEVYEILKARSRVFMLEQGIRCLDMDDMDYKSLHIFSMEAGKVTAYLRAFSLSQEGDVKIGRVLTVHHGQGLGRILMEKSMQLIQREMKGKRICVDAQIQARPFYEKCGFVVVSDEFMEEGIPHIKMEQWLKPPRDML